MGLILVEPVEQYELSIRALFPRGEFWDQQFSDPGSDVSKWCEAKAIELHRFKTRRAELLDESMLQTADELLGRWEETFGCPNPDRPIDERRNIVRLARSTTKEPPSIRSIVEGFGGTLVGVEVGRQASFGLNTFGSTFGAPGVSNLCYIFVELADVSKRADLHDELGRLLLASSEIRLLFRTVDNVFVP